MQNLPRLLNSDSTMADRLPQPRKRAARSMGKGHHLLFFLVPLCSQVLQHTSLPLTSPVVASFPFGCMDKELLSCGDKLKVHCLHRHHEICVAIVVSGPPEGILLSCLQLMHILLDSTQTVHNPDFLKGS